MSELKRWTDDGAPQEIERLLRAAESEQPSAASLAGALTSLGVVAGVTSGATVAGAAGSTALTAAAIPGKLSVVALTVSLAKWIALGSIVGGGAMAVYVAASDAPGPSRQGVAPQESTGPTVHSNQRRQPPPGSAAASLASGGPTADPNQASNLDARQSAPRTSSRAGASLRRDADGAGEQASGSGAVPVETLAEEIAGIDRARSLVAAGRHTAAIAALDDYERRFPRHHFAPEALYLRMEASRGAGRTQEARLLAERLLAAYPTSPQSEKARRLLDRKIE